MSVDFNEFSRRMDKTLEVLGENFGSVRAGRANAAVLDRIMVDYYGTPTLFSRSRRSPPRTPGFCRSLRGTVLR